MRRRLTRDEQQAEALIGQWAEWVRHERRAIAGGYGSMWPSDGAEFESELPYWVSVEDCQQVNRVYKAWAYQRPLFVSVVELAWGIDRAKRDNCQRRYGNLKSSSQAKFLKLGTSRYYAILGEFRAEVVESFRVGG